MDSELARLIDSSTPKLNALLANGLAVEECKHAEHYIDHVFKAAARSFPSGLEYVGYKPCDPLEEYNKVTNKNLSPKQKKERQHREFDFARSDLQLYKYAFTYNGVSLPLCYLSLPFVGPAGYLYLDGGRFNISPVLIDRVISVVPSGIFVPLLKARLVFKRMPIHYMFNGVRRTVQAVYSDNIHNKRTKAKAGTKIIRAKSLMTHYLFAKYGVTETFRRYGRCNPVFGGPEMNTNTFPPDEWVICSSAQLPPRGMSKGKYVPTSIRIAIRREEMNYMAQHLVVGFFYVADHFPERIHVQFIDHLGRWRVLLGHISWPGMDSGEGQVQSRVDQHILSLDTYLDSFTLERMRELNWPVNDMYDVFAMMTEHFDEWYLQGNRNLASMYDKELSILYYLLGDITRNINLFSYAAVALLNKKRPANMSDAVHQKRTIEGLTALLKRYIAPWLIFKVKHLHGEISSNVTPGDNKAFKVTSRLVRQSESRRVVVKDKKGKQQISPNDPTRFLHASLGEVGGYASMQKSGPDGRNTLNLHVRIDQNNVIVRNPERRELLDEVQSAISRSPILPKE